MKSQTLIFLLLFVSNLSLGQISEIVEVVTGHRGTLLFLCGSKSSDGYNIDTFPNGTKKLEGKFSKGKAVGTIKSYFQNGQISESRDFRKGNLIREETFDSTGKLTKTVNWRKKVSITYEYASHDLLGKTVFNWKHGGWNNGKTTMFKWEKNKWLKE